MKSSRPVVALLRAPGEDDSAYRAAIKAYGGEPLPASLDDESLPRRADALVIGGAGASGLSGKSPPAALESALAAGIPVLAINRGMHALNVALGGSPAAPVKGHARVDESGTVTAVRHRIFMALGGKVAEAIGGAGVVMVPSLHTCGLRPAHAAARLMLTAYGLDDGVIEAIELPGFRWVVGVQWPAERIAELPSGFGGLFGALVSRAAA